MLVYKDATMSQNIAFHHISVGTTYYSAIKSHGSTHEFGSLSSFFFQKSFAEGFLWQACISMPCWHRGFSGTCRNSLWKQENHICFYENRKELPGNIPSWQELKSYWSRGRLELTLTGCSWGQWSLFGGGGRWGSSSRPPPAAFQVSSVKVLGCTCWRGRSEWHHACHLEVMIKWKIVLSSTEFIISDVYMLVRQWVETQCFQCQNRSKECWKIKYWIFHGSNWNKYMSSQVDTFENLIWSTTRNMRKLKPFF